MPLKPSISLELELFIQALNNAPSVEINAPEIGIGELAKEGYHVAKLEEQQQRVGVGKGRGG